VEALHGLHGLHGINLKSEAKKERKSKIE